MATQINDSVRRRTTRNLAIFIAVTLGIGWLGRLLDLVTGRPSIVTAISVMIAWAIVYGELLLLTRSIWPAVLMHSVEDAFVNPLFTQQWIVVHPGADWLVSPVNGIISVALFVGFGVGLNRHRRTRGS